MRPLRLQVKGFTAFRDEQEIDLSALDLFAIWGPTGSGKSSLLDAMTYALYGYVERVGREASRLISQGQPRLTVLLDFEVEGVPYRVNRSTNASATKVLLERRNGEGFVSFGEGADRVREANRHIEELIGLDYEAFTRSVVLPQGKFAEFLIGDASERRKILTELLGLELFGRMAKRSGEIASLARAQADALAKVIEHEYAGLSADAVRQANEAAKAALHRAASAKSACDTVKEICNQTDEITRHAAATRQSAVELDGLGKEITSVAGALTSAVADLKTAHDLHARTEKERDRRARASSKAETARRETEERWGGNEATAGLEAKLAELRERETELTEEEQHVAGAGERREQAQAAAKVAEAALGPAVEAVANTSAALAAAKSDHDHAHRADLVGALTAGLETGAPCPVCERPLETVPKSERTRLKKTAAALEAAGKQLEAARAAQAAADKAVALTRQEVKAAERDLAQTKNRTAALTKRAETLRAEVAAALGSDISKAEAELERRRGILAKLIEDEVVARGTLDDAQKEATELERSLSARLTNVAKHAASLVTIDVAGALARAAIAAEVAQESEPWPPDGELEPEKLLMVAERVAETVAERAATLARESAGTSEDLEKLSAAARRALPHWIETPETEPRHLLKILESSEREAATEATTLKRAAEEAHERLQRKAKLEQQIEEALAEHGVFRALATELKADRLVAFLQAEALQVLAAAGSERLAYLSNGRYRLDFADEEFFVIDAWNGEDRRSARTLSGGETFMASLALALALSEQVSLLAVGERARLDSLFLDEGFGSLDAETLEIVVSAIEQLGGDGRLIGVITHVPELAERLPARLVVTKSPRGSTVALQT